MIPILRIAAAVSAAAFLLAACGLHRIPPPERRSAVDTARIAAAVTPPVPAARPVSIAAADAQLLDQARARYAEARAALPQWADAAELQTLLDAAGSAARSGDGAGTRALAAEVLRRANDALDVHLLLRAEIELQKLQTYTGLSDEQLERMRIAEVALASRQGRRAFELLSALNQALAQATQRYVVAAGDTLWIISGRPEVYGNPRLWPLIWDANRDVLADPNRVRAGQRLKIRPNPTIEEVVAAVERAHSYRSTTVRIGEVRESAR